jgi:hypothetical protein
MRASDIQQTGKGCSASLLPLVKGHSTPLQSTKKNLCRSTAAQTRVFNQNLSSQVKRQTAVKN